MRGHLPSFFCLDIEFTPVYTGVMQTFLPYENFEQSFKCLDYRRLGKQRVEAYQILNVLLKRNNKKGWTNHPATQMWRGFENCLKHYFNLCVDEWKNRGYKNTMKYEEIDGEIIYPSWIGNKDFHLSHQSNLLRKDYDFYISHFEGVPSNLPYIWPTATS